MLLPLDAANFLAPNVSRSQHDAPKWLRQKLEPLLPGLKPRSAFEDADTNLNFIQSVLRIARNEAGHPTGAAAPQREQVYIFLQLFIPLARQLMMLRQALK